MGGWERERREKINNCIMKVRDLLRQDIHQNGKTRLGSTLVPHQQNFEINPQINKCSRTFSHSTPEDEIYLNFLFYSKSQFLHSTFIIEWMNVWKKLKAKQCFSWVVKNMFFYGKNYLFFSIHKVTCFWCVKYNLLKV